MKKPHRNKQQQPTQHKRKPAPTPTLLTPQEARNRDVILRNEEKERGK